MFVVTACTENLIEVPTPHAIGNINPPALSIPEATHAVPLVQARQTKQWCDTHPEECPGADADQFPNEPGYYLGGDATWANCLSGPNGPGGDVDRDGVADICEQWIAEAFAPELFHSAFDQWMGRESYWAVAQHGSQMLKLFYAIGYYVDGGAWDGICVSNPHLSDCLGHSGDSEAIVVYVSYDPLTRHWKFENAFFSHHGDWSFQTASSVEFPDKPLGYPRSYVAYGKHANYRNDSECDNGGAFNADDCESSVRARVGVYDSRNLGSRDYPMRTCVRAEENYGLYLTGYYECFWTAAYFTGWSGDNHGGVAGYGGQLAQYGF